MASLEYMRKNVMLIVGGWAALSTEPGGGAYLPSVLALRPFTLPGEATSDNAFQF